MRKVHLFALLVAAASSAIVAAPAAGEHGTEQGFNQPGNILIADQFNNRAIEINRNHQIVWSFGNGSKVAGPHSIVGLNDAERVGDLTLLAGTGAPPAPSPTEPGCEASGCPDNRVILVDEDGEIVWQYGKAGVTGSGPEELNTPVFAAALPGGDVLITDQGNSRVIEVNPGKQIVWQYGTTGVPGKTHNHLNNPNSAELLANGHILIADENNNRVIEVTREHKIVWQYGKVTDTSIINGAAFASRLPNGNTLITDTGNSRVLEVTPG
jgi:outer membrane protein assembly factor BamB